MKLLEGISITDVEEEGILIDVNKGKYVRINETAFLILKSLLNNDSRERIVEIMTENYKINKEKAFNDVDVITKKLAGMEIFEQE